MQSADTALLIRKQRIQHLDGCRHNNGLIPGLCQASVCLFFSIFHHHIAVMFQYHGSVPHCLTESLSAFCSKMEMKGCPHKEIVLLFPALFCKMAGSNRRLLSVFSRSGRHGSDDRASDPSPPLFCRNLRSPAGMHSACFHFWIVSYFF